MPIHAQWLVTGDGVNQLDFERLVCVFVMFNGAGTVPYFCANFVAQVDDFLHLLLNRAEVFGRERFGAVKVIIPAVFDHRADGDFYIGPQLLHGAGHDVGKVMPDQLKRCGVVFHGVDGDAGVGFDGPLQVPVLAIQGGRNGLFAQRIGNAGGNFGSRDACVKIAGVAIGECQGNLRHGRQAPRRFGAYKAPGCGYVGRICGIWRAPEHKSSALSV